MKTNSNEALDLYAQIEDLIGVKEVAPTLNSYYFDILSNFNFNSLIDIGCGKGDFLQKLSIVEPNAYLLGIDKSCVMVKEAIKRGINAKCAQIFEIEEEFDIAVAIFDMVNYLTPKEFKEFFNNLSNRVVKNGGYFIFDINTLYGLSELAVGNFIAEDEDRFLAIESFFEDNIYESIFTLFKKSKDNLYTKRTQQINQYYYNKDDIKALNNWEILDIFPINLYKSESIDKNIFVLRNKRA